MSSDKHTQGNVEIFIQPMPHGTDRTINIGSKRIATMHFTGNIEESEANAERIVECWNGWDSLLKENKLLKERAAELEQQILNHVELD